MIDVRRSGRVAEGTPLLRVQTGKNRSRGFESLFLRHFYARKKPLRTSQNLLNQ